MEARQSGMESCITLRYAELTIAMLQQPLFLARFRPTSSRKFVVQFKLEIIEP